MILRRCDPGCFRELSFPRTLCVLWSAVPDKGGSGKIPMNHDLLYQESRMSLWMFRISCVYSLRWHPSESASSGLGLEIAEALERPLIISPARQDAYFEFQIDFASRHGLDFPARQRADFTQHAPILPDHDPLLR